MDFGEILRVIRKRWYITLPGVVLALGLTLIAYLVVPTKYESQATLSLINSPRPVTAPGNGNPFLSFESSLTATADFLARSLGAEETARELKTMGVTEEYTAALADNAMGPFITLTVIGTDRAHVQRSTTILTEYAQRKLRTMQEQSGAPENSMIHAATIIPPQPPEPVIKKKIEVVAGTAGVLLTLTFAATFITESLLRSRQRAGLPTTGAASKHDVPSDHTRVIVIPRQAPATEPTSHPAGTAGTAATAREVKFPTLYRSGAAGRRTAESDAPVEN
jgi:hypothetical protein